MQGFTIKYKTSQLGEEKTLIFLLPEITDTESIEDYHTMLENALKILDPKGMQEFLDSLT